MTRDPDPPPLSDAESEALGRMVQRASLTLRAPASLRERLAQDSARAPKPRRRRIRILPVAGAASALAAGIVAVVLALGGSSGPSLASASALALARPTGDAPAVVASDPRLVTAGVDDLRFPNYAYVWPAWRVAGQRRQTVGDRTAVTVTYQGPRSVVGYTIVDGPALDVPGHFRRMTVDGVHLAVDDRGDDAVVTWRRDGHTCILAGSRADIAQMVRFATWT
jgi:hypothetical protein